MGAFLNRVSPQGMVALWRGLVPLILAAQLTGVAAAAEPVFTGSAAPLTKAPALEATQIATIAVAARLDRLETRDGYHRVRLEGWARDGVARVLFGRPGKRILVASIPKAQAGELLSVEEAVDPDTGITWHRMQIEGWVPVEGTQPRIDPIWDAAWALFAERCTACHQRRIPEHYTANQWRSHIKVMGPRTGLPKADQMLILAFLQNHASDTIALRHDTGAPADPDARR